MIEFAHYKGKQNKKNGIEVTPLIDMVFLLLIFFLLTSYYTKPTIPVLLPEAESARMSKNPEIIIVVKKDGSFMVEKEVVTKAALPGMLTSLLAVNPEKKIHIQADTLVHFGIIVQLMDIAHKAGAEDIAFVVEKKADSYD